MKLLRVFLKEGCKVECNGTTTSTLHEGRSIVGLRLDQGMIRWTDVKTSDRKGTHVSNARDIVFADDEPTGKR